MRGGEADEAIYFMINLEKISGLPIELTDDYHLKFNPPLTDREPTIVRKFSELMPVLMEQGLKPDYEDRYFVYRAISLPEDEAKVKKYHLTYDVTILPPGKLGAEFNKTVGHYHANIPGKNIAHPEIYEVLNGRALFVLQKMDAEFRKVISVLVIEADRGQKVVYPPNYGHVIYNIGPDPVVTANWCSTNYKALYEPVAQLHGLAYFVTASPHQPFDLAANRNYGEIPAARMFTNKFMSGFSIVATNRPMYIEGMLHPDELEFLSNPEKYAVELSSISS
ncbi:MAG: hypothetical protein A3B10_00795 [Candidatus Doudnabacteria bacterium RIFCSPLOWO2_01_FULL_44_21]|uniref:glucose-6-phosphate isomerase n=1 Tax=Candidatus Doudnabacteria bacterium RIFCSPLOWO2_01_FULL_44_21 TaxID=1817841 RepID=A0A1F5PXN1_9BACT|nr:MAG: hypothetical protein A3B10_00795 [Candidatus Doudnabacteria bacterium RIFCSPLOWO2_01_FULL_44_21]